MKRPSTFPIIQDAVNSSNTQARYEKDISKNFLKSNDRKGLRKISKPIIYFDIVKIILILRKYNIALESSLF